MKRSHASTSNNAKSARQSSAGLSGAAGQEEPSVFMVDASSVFMCKICNAILAEGRSACEYNKELNVIACLKATKTVIVDNEVKNNVNEGIKVCVFSFLKCKICVAALGMFLYSTAAEFAHLRDMFCFFANSIVCYSMKTKQMIEGNKIDVNVSQCTTQLRELKRELFATEQRIRHLVTRVTNENCADQSCNEG
ncbi:protein Mis18-beta [Anomaloglossus baeobatrachus]|uniref:protein Mis18-beta n=1 Tax=Anomaloglossus baeobatrachus TaxID=238106 RepID=UPI003F4FF121